MYASENDIGNVPGLGSEQFAHPHTPQKPRTVSPEPQIGSGVQDGSKHRSRNKSRAKNPNSVVSPDVSRQIRRSTPQSVPVNSKASSAMAFAGATFHASPAPSALPMPSFYSKAIPESSGPRAANKDVHPQPSPPATNPELPSHKYPSTAPAARESPLDAIFRADRAEKEKARRRGSVRSPAKPYGFGSPFPQSPKDDGSPFAPKSHHTNPGQRLPFHRSSSGASQAEFDGFSGKPLGPAFSTPYQERIRAARATPDQPTGPPSGSPNASADDRSEALKKYLFGDKFACASPQTGATTTYPGGSPAGNGSHDDEVRTTDLRVMEDNLRRILKLDSSITTAKSGERPLYS
ncbi:hypothetical protein C8035_v006861 [Colletotrichum spinosum]|uniref:Proteophosphoglycan 5 n=1 Tax=Colletotrichum spinosum TaxID=1347390 RepID=A0A4R8PXY8_9PEZI|nr:hypothetical protein C8035_v006861 [Colletotrichum spinosum]